MTYHVQFLLLVLAGWVNRQQQDVIDYLQEENRVLRAGVPSIYSSASPWVGSQPCGTKYPGFCADSKGV